MTKPSSQPPTGSHPSSRVVGGVARRAAAFSLVELLLVLTVIVAVISICAPALANFFRGRTLDSEARRLLSLSHAGQSRAISEGLPMMFWVDASKGSYGLEAQPGWSDRDPKAVEFNLDQDLHLEIIAANPVKHRSFLNQSRSAGDQRANSRGLPQIRYLPDGTIEETSPRAIRVYDRDGTSLWLARVENYATYEIRKTFE